MPPGSPGKYLVARLGGEDVAAVGSVTDGAPPMAVWNMYVWVDSADETAAKVTGAGGSVLSGPFDVPGAGRMAVCADPEGAAFSLWEAKGHDGAQLVNAPGSWNFSDLNTRDPDAAAAFYGAVFGWRRFGSGEFAMWTLPGYGDLLERRDPGTRKRMADIGAPEGFEDVVATIVPIGDDRAEIGRAHV